MKRKLQVARSGRSGERKRFLGLSAFAWGLPVVMTSLCAYFFKTYTQWLYRNSGEYATRRTPWYCPTLGETRTCFNEMVMFGQGRWLISQKSGSALFFYGPVSVLAVANVVFLGITLTKVQFLRRGNSVLRRDDDRVPLVRKDNEQANEAKTQGAETANSEGKKRGRRKGGGSATVPDANTIRLYIKMLLMTGAVEIIAEAVGWAASNLSSHEANSLRDYTLSYRATGYVTDCFRAACVAWLAAPEDGYLGALWRRLRGEESGGRGAERSRSGR